MPPDAGDETQEGANRQRAEQPDFVIAARDHVWTNRICEATADCHDKQEQCIPVIRQTENCTPQPPSLDKGSRTGMPSSMYGDGKIGAAGANPAPLPAQQVDELPS